MSEPCGIIPVMPADPPRWHPIMAAVETEPGVWDMTDTLGKIYGHIEIRRTPDGPRYRAETLGNLIGWGTTLRGACERIHHVYLRTHGPGASPETMFRRG